MRKREWVSWKMGRNFGLWHAPASGFTVQCGAIIPPQASKCYASDEFATWAAAAPNTVCKKCQEALLGAERIP